MTNIKRFSDKYREITPEEIILGGRVLETLIKQSEKLDVVYYLTSVGEWELKHAIEEKIYLSKSFITDIVVAPVSSLFELKQMNEFLDFLVRELVLYGTSELRYRKEFGLFGTDQKDMAISRGELWLKKVIGEYEIKADVHDENIANLLNAEFGRISSNGEITHPFKIAVYPDVKVAQRAYPYFDDTQISVNLAERAYKI